MLEERSSLSADDHSGPPVTAVVSGAPIPGWKLIVLGVLACVLWLGAVFGDVAGLTWAQTGDVIPVWSRVSIHAALVLAPTALAIVWLRSPRMPSGRSRMVVYVVVATLAMLVLALPALLPYDAPQDLVSMPLRVPTLSLGVALALVDPQLARSRTQNGSGSSPEAVVGLSFGFACLAAGVLLLEITRLTSRCNAGLACGGLSTASSFVVCGEASFCLITGVAGAWIGYAVGRWVTKING